MSDNPIDESEANDLPVVETQPAETPRQARANDTVLETYRHSATTEIHDEVYRCGAMIGRYRIECLLGTGGFANVYRAVDTELERVVAIKVPRTSALSSGVDMTRYVEEAKAMAKLSHPNIVPIHDVVHESGMAIIVMKFIDGMTLRQRLDSGTIPIDLATQIIAQISAAIAFAHDCNLIHRDLKPQNILLDQSGQAYVTDFGLAIEFSDQATRETEFAGTRDYMLPELAGSVLIANWTCGKSDLWALGVTTYEILTGELPKFRERKDPDSPALTLLNPSHFNRSVTAALDTFCQKSLAIDPNARFQTAAAFLNEFRSAADSTKDQPAAQHVTPSSATLNQQTFLAANGAKTASILSLGLLIAAAFFAIVHARNSKDPIVEQPRFVSGEAPVCGATSDSERDVAVKVIQWGGQLGLLPVSAENSITSEISELSQIPDVPFVVDWVTLVDTQNADELLHSLVGLEHAVGIDLCRSDVTNGGLANLKSFGSLQEGLFYGCRNLTDRGIACVLSDTQFVSLILSETSVGEQTFSQIANQQRLAHLRLHRTATNDESLASLGNLPMLAVLRVDYAKVTDAGTHHLAGIGSLRELGLSGNAISDKTLLHLHGLKNLRLLDVSDTNVTPKGVANLKAATPGLEVIVAAIE